MPKIAHLARPLSALTCAAALLTAGAAPATSAPASHAHRCTPSVAVGNSTVTVHFQGTGYPVPLAVPRREGRRTVPLVLDLHGSSSNGVAQDAVSDLKRLGTAAGFAVASPSGAIPVPATGTAPPDGSFAWNVPGVPTTAGQFPPPGARDDVGFLSAVVDQVSRAACVDPRRVYATGYSGGGRMASALACARPEEIAALAPVAGLRAGRPSPADAGVPEVQDCRPSRPVPVLTFHGTADAVNPYQGSADLRWGYSAPVAVQTWARVDGCRRGPTATVVGEHVTLFRYSRCDGGADVEFYSVAGGGHTWPGSPFPSGPLGPTTQEISASALVLRFFQAHPHQA